jgi:hypothetical protein
MLLIVLVASFYNNQYMWMFVFQKNKDGIRVAIGKSILYLPTYFCHLKLFNKILFKRLISCVMLSFP